MNFTKKSPPAALFPAAGGVQMILHPHSFAVLSVLFPLPDLIQLFLHRLLCPLGRRPVIFPVF